MMDQVKRLGSKGLSACYLNSEVPMAEREVIVHNLLVDSTPYNFLFLTPESATSSEMLGNLQQMKERIYRPPVESTF